MDGRTDEWMDGRMDVQTDRQTDIPYISYLNLKWDSDVYLYFSVKSHGFL
jgi:hypothetical protein